MVPGSVICNEAASPARAVGGLSSMASGCVCNEAASPARAVGGLS